MNLKDFDDAFDNKIATGQEKSWKRFSSFTSDHQHIITHSSYLSKTKCKSKTTIYLPVAQLCFLDLT